VSWNPVLPAGVTSVYQEYLATLRTGDGAIVRSEFVTPIPGGPVSNAYTGLEYNQSYIVEVLAYAPDGCALGVACLWPPFGNYRSSALYFEQPRELVARAGEEVACGVGYKWRP
jgi:hypothetical protein